jgi:hypothetical protein
MKYLASDDISRPELMWWLMSEAEFDMIAGMTMSDTALADPTSCKMGVSGRRDHRRTNRQREE